jgi:hypothetical protein
MLLSVVTERPAVDKSHNDEELPAVFNTFGEQYVKHPRHVDNSLTFWNLVIQLQSLLPRL